MKRFVQLIVTVSCLGYLTMQSSGMTRSQIANTMKQFNNALQGGDDRAAENIISSLREKNLDRLADSLEVQLLIQQRESVEKVSKGLRKAIEEYSKSVDIVVQDEDVLSKSVQGVAKLVEVGHKNSMDSKQKLTEQRNQQNAIVNDLNEKIRELQEQLDQWPSSATQDEITDLKEKMETLRKNYVSLLRERKQTEDTIQAMATQNKVLSADIKRLMDTKKNITDNLQKSETQKQNLLGQQQQTEKSLKEDYKKTLDASQHQLESLKKDLEEKKQQIAPLDSEINGKNQEFTSIAQTIQTDFDLMKKALIGDENDLKVIIDDKNSAWVEPLKNAIRQTPLVQNLGFQVTENNLFEKINTEVKNLSSEAKAFSDVFGNVSIQEMKDLIKVWFKKSGIELQDKNDIAGICYEHRAISKEAFELVKTNLDPYVSKFSANVVKEFLAAFKQDLQKQLTMVVPDKQKNKNKKVADDPINDFQTLQQALVLVKGEDMFAQYIMHEAERLAYLTLWTIQYDISDLLRSLKKALDWGDATKAKIMVATNEQIQQGGLQQGGLWRLPESTSDDEVDPLAWIADLYVPLKLLWDGFYFSNRSSEQDKGLSFFVKTMIDILGIPKGLTITWKAAGKKDSKDMTIQEIQDQLDTIVFSLVEIASEQKPQSDALRDEQKKRFEEINKRMITWFGN
ncbi:MAG: hypothetical protein WBQ73_02700 [Candidatus Babeliales bacterium]